MPSLQKRNDDVIKRAFRTLVGSRDAAIEAGMRSLMQNAMLYAIGIHDNTHYGHRITANSYGWLLMHNGSTVDIVVNEGRHGEGRARDDLMEVSREAKQTGWVGILLASMEAETDRSGNVYFVVEYEQDILRETQESIKDSFNRYFKPLR